MKNSFYDEAPIPDVDLPEWVIERENALLSNIGRREFLKLSGLAGGGLALGIFLASGNRAWAAGCLLYTSPSPRDA